MKAPETTNARHEIEVEAEDRRTEEMFTRTTYLYPFRTEREFLQDLDMPDRYWRILRGGKERYFKDPGEWGDFAGKNAQRDGRRYLEAGRPNAATRKVYDKILNDPELNIKAQVNRRQVPNARRFITPCEEGDSVNIERAQARESDCWECHTFKSTRQRTVSIGINYSSGHSSPALFQNLGAAAAVVLGSLRAQGYRVRLIGTRIIATEYGDPESPLVGIYWPIIDFGERFDIERILCWGHNMVFNWWARVWTYHLYSDEYSLIKSKSGYGQMAPQIPTGALRNAGVDHIIYTPTSRGVHLGDIIGETITAVGGTFN